MSYCLFMVFTVMFTIYKVGHANAITIQKDGKCILFDCGKGNTASKSVSKEICNLKPDILIISH